MAYVSLLSETDLSIELFKRGQSHCAQILLGYDDEHDLSYHLHVTLDFLPGHDDELEYSFYIVEYDGENDEMTPIYSSEYIGTKIPQEHKTIVLAAVACATRHLLNSAKPARVFACTHDPNPPKKAHAKFIILAKIFEECGYKVTTADPYNGRQAWWMSKE